MECTKNNTKLYYSYLLSNLGMTNTVEIMLRKRKARGLPITRSKQSYINEIKAHKLLYNLGLFRKHTRDTDLEENISKLKDLLYSVLAIFCR